MRDRLAASVAVLFGALSGEGAVAEGFNRADWLEDLEQIKTAIAVSSPNLDWGFQRGLDLESLDAKARRRLEAASDELVAARALDRFVESFGDGHMFISWPTKGAGSNAAAPRTKCADLGYFTPDDEGAIATRIADFENLSPKGAFVTAGVAKIGKRRVGVLRLPLFAPSEEMCEQAFADINLGSNATCDGDCIDELGRRSDALFLEEITARVQAVRSAKVQALIVDIAGNGGGSDTSIAIARMLGGADLKSPAIYVAKSAERAEQFSEEISDLKTGLDAALPGEAAMLTQLIAKLSRAREDALQPCDQSMIWRGARPDCSQLVSEGFFAAGLIDRELPAEAADAAWAETVSSVARFGPSSHIWKGPLIILVDQNSASSAELFAAMLQDGGRAMIVGAPTFGAGCGWNMPHEDIVLKNSGARLAIPNCARFRANGTNEIDGVEPDILVGFRDHDTPAQRVRRFMTVVPQALKAVGRRK